MADPLRAVIIDDEPPAREELKRLLEPHPHIAVVGEAGNVAGARRRLRKPHDYDLVFLDVQLIGGSGFDLVPDVAPGAQVIFFTAHQEHALRAFEVNALDFLLKPATAERLAASLERAATAAMRGPVPTGNSGELKADDLLLIRTEAGSRFVDVTEIAAVQSEQNYTRVHFVSGDHQLIHRPLKSWEEQLPQPAFLRVHRQWLVNTSHLAAVKTPIVGSTRLKLTGVADTVEVSRRRWSEVSAYIERR
ncbi:MAG: LytTR family DNA-binding domain-containing protein [Synoicihabitans sp.]